MRLLQVQKIGNDNNSKNFDIGGGWQGQKLEAGKSGDEPLEGRRSSRGGEHSIVDKGGESELIRKKKTEIQNPTKN